MHGFVANNIPRYTHNFNKTDKQALYIVPTKELSNHVKLLQFQYQSSSLYLTHTDFTIQYSQYSTYFITAIMIITTGNFILI